MNETGRISSLSSPGAVSVLERLRAIAAVEDEPAEARVKSREAELRRKLSARERADLCGGASLAITAEVGELLYVLVSSRRPRTIVEFGSSLGFSTIYLAAAARDAGQGRVIGTELQPDKVPLARANLVEAGLGDLVEIWEGDALETLRGLEQPIELLFLDGWNDLYAAVLELLERWLVPGSLVVADLSKDDPDLVSYCEHVHDEHRGYFSIELPLDDGVILSVKVA